MEKLDGKKWKIPYKTGENARKMKVCGRKCYLKIGGGGMLKMHNVIYL